MKYKLSEVMDLIGGGTPKTSKTEYWNGDIPWLSVKDFNNGFRYVYETEKSITQGYDRQYPTYSLQLLLLAGGRVLHIEKSGKTHTQSENRHKHQRDILR